MPRYDDSPSAHRSGGHSPMDRRSDGRRPMKSPVISDGRRRQRDSPMSRMSRGDPYDDYRHPSGRPDGHHRSSDSNSSSLPYKILCVSNLSSKYADGAIREALTREFHRFGEPSVKLVYDDNTRLAYLYFRNYDDARDARHAKSRLVLFDKTIIIDPIYDRAIQMQRRRSVSPDYQRGSLRGPPSPPMPRGRPPPPPPMRNNMSDMKYMQSHRNDHYNRDMHNVRNDYHHSGGSGGAGGGGGGANRQQRDSKKEKFPNYLHHIPPEEDDKATRTLFIGNLEVTITDADLRRIFERYGVVEDIDVKRPPPGQGNAYAFIKFLNLDMAHRAKVEMSGQYIGKFQCKIGYGKATPTTRIWVGGLGPWTSLSHLGKEFDRFGAIRKIDFVKGDNHAYILYDTLDAAQAACAEMRGFPLGGQERRLRIDYADPGPYSTVSPARSCSANAGGGDQLRREEPNDEFYHNRNSGEFNDQFDRRSQRDFPDDIKREFPMAASGPNFDIEPDRKRQRRISGGSPNPYDTLTSPRRSRAGDSTGRGSPSYETNGKEEVSKVSVNANVTTIAELVKCCPQTWIGGLVLKTSSFPSRMFCCAGDTQLVDLFMRESAPNASQTLRITQRLRLLKQKLDEVTGRINYVGNSGHCLLLTTSAAPPAVPATQQLSEDGSVIHFKPLKILVSYLKQKEAAGVISLSTTKEGKESDSKGVLYLFPPCAYAVELLNRVAPNLSAEESPKDDYLVAVVVRGAN